MNALQKCCILLVLIILSALFCLLQSLCNSQDAAVDSPQQPGSPRGPFLGVPKGTIRRQTSIGVWLFHFVLLLKYIFTQSFYFDKLHKKKLSSRCKMIQIFGLHWCRHFSCFIP